MTNFSTLLSVRKMFLIFLMPFGFFTSQAQVIGDFFGYSGTIGTENKQAVSRVTLTVLRNDTAIGSAATISDGSYIINFLPLNADFTVKASKSDLNGRTTDVTSWDIALVSQHILGIRSLKDPYWIIAADVDNSGEIDATDLLLMRRFVLGISTSFPAGVWRFIDKSYVFKNPLNPLAENFPEYVNIKSNSSNFIAIEVGDVNSSYESSPVGIRTKN